MSADQHSASYDPRYDGIYQRGGAGSPQQPQETLHLPPQIPSPFPQAPSRSRQQAVMSDQPTSGDRPVGSRSVTPSGSASQSPSERQQGGDHPASSTPANYSDTSDPSPIREIGAQPEAPEVPARARNPLDVWIWVVAAVLTGIGGYLTAAPILFERAMMEAQATGMSGSVYLNPWYNYTMSVAPTLVLLGVGTAVVQLFVLSIRHTLRSRPDAGVHGGSHSGP